MNTSVDIDFSPDKSQILRGIAIIFMIALHNDTLPGFKICVPIFTFLVGYGYAFAKDKNLKHGLKRSWHLLSHFWLILLGICLPTAILAGGFKPTLGGVLPELFGLDSQLNWYSWYIYFYIYAMAAMIPASRLISRFKLSACCCLIVLCLGAVFAIHQIPNWSGNIYIQAIHDCFLCSPVMFVGFYLAEGGGITGLLIKRNLKTAILLIAIMVSIFAVRALPHIALLDFVLVPVFCSATVALFNIIKWRWLHNVLITVGNESMNMWFLHALFATSYTAVVFAPPIMWIQPKILTIAAMVIASYFAARMMTAIYNKLSC